MKKPSYDRNEIYKLSIQAIAENDIIFLEEIYAFLPCARQTWWQMFPAGSEENEEFKQLIYKNRIERKTQLRRKWFKSENATLQISLYKLIADGDEHKRLSQTSTDITTGGEKLPTIVLQSENGVAPLHNNEEDVDDIEDNE